MATQSAYLEKITVDYLPAFLSFAMKNINDLHEAEEFSQEVAYQCVLAITKSRGDFSNFNGFVWSIAHNTYKRWCARKKHVSLDACNAFSNVMQTNVPLDSDIIHEEAKRRIHLELSRLANLYRKTLVCFYYDEMSIAETAEKLSMSIEMVKFYLQKGRQKLKEAYSMNIGEKSFNPSEFSVYKASIDFSQVNVWEVFKRKLPCQIALVCHDGDKSVSELSLETGVPAVYIEEELGLLMEAGVMVSPVRNKYRTNLHVLKQPVLVQITEQFGKLHDTYLPVVMAAYDKYLPEMKEQGIFKHDVPDHRYAWFFADKVSDFDYSNSWLSDEDYPQLLSCGSRGFIFATEAGAHPWAAGQTPTELPACTVWPRDVGILGAYRHQRQLSHQNPEKSQALYDLYIGRNREADIELYAQLIEEGYAIKQHGQLFCHVAVSTQNARKLFDKINAALHESLAPLCNEIRENINRIVKATLPPQLKKFAKGYGEIWLMALSGVLFYEALYKKGFLTLPAEDDHSPIACWIYEK